MNDFGEPVELREAGVAVLDCEHKTPVARLTGHPYVAIPDVVGGRIDLTSARRISDSDLKEWTRRTKPSPGDVLVTRRGRVGDTAIIPPNVACAIGQNLVLLRSDGRQIRQDYLRWAARSPQWWAEVDRLRNVGAIFSSLNVRDIARIRIPLPPLSDQATIAEVLAALDDKIAANAQIARSALRLAGSLFDRELERAIPVRLEDVSTIVLGGTPAKARTDFWSNGTIPWMASGKANEERILRPTSLITSEALTQSAAKLMPRGATVVAITGATLGQISRLEIEACGNQSLVGIWGASTWDSDWLYFAIRSERDQLLRGATGAAQQHVNKADVENLQVPWVDEPVRRDWGAVAGKLLERARQADVESHSITELRDTLLPELMSGRLRVMDAERLTRGQVG